jgi:hypothetical protein
MSRKTVIHVNQHHVKHNGKTGERKPVITCKDYKSNRYGHEVILFDGSGVECARVVYSPDKPLSCGAKVWIETYNDIEVR